MKDVIKMSPFGINALEDLLKNPEFKNILSGKDLQNRLSKEYKSEDSDTQNAIKEMKKNMGAHGDKNGENAGAYLYKIIDLAQGMGLSLEYGVTGRGQFKLDVKGGDRLINSQTHDIDSVYSGYENGMPSIKGLAAMVGEKGAFAGTSLERNLQETKRTLEGLKLEYDKLKGKNSALNYDQRNDFYSTAKENFNKAFYDGFERSKRTSTGHATLGMHETKQSDTPYYAADSQTRMKFLSGRFDISEMLKYAKSRVTDLKERMQKQTGKKSKAIDDNYIDKTLSTAISVYQNRNFGDKNTRSDIARAYLNERGIDRDTANLMFKDLKPLLDLSNTFAEGSDESISRKEVSTLGENWRPLGMYGRTGRSQQQGGNILSKIKPAEELERGIKNAFRVKGAKYDPKTKTGFDYDDAAERQLLYSDVTGDAFYKAYSEVRNEAAESTYKRLEEQYKKNGIDKTEDELKKEVNKKLYNQGYREIAPALYDDASMIRASTAQEIAAQRPRTTMISSDAYENLVKQAKEKYKEFFNTQSAAAKRKGKDFHGVKFAGKQYQSLSDDFINEFVAGSGVINNLKSEDILSGGVRVERVKSHGNKKDMYKIWATQKVLPGESFKGATHSGKRTNARVINDKIFDKVLTKLKVDQNTDVLSERKIPKSDKMASTLMNRLKYNFEQSSDKQGFIDFLNKTPLKAMTPTMDSDGNIIFNQNASTLKTFNKNGGVKELYNQMLSGGYIPNLEELNTPISYYDSLNMGDVYDWTQRVKVGDRYRDSALRVAKESGSDEEYQKYLTEKLSGNKGLAKLERDRAIYNQGQIKNALENFMPQTANMSDENVANLLNSGNYISIGMGSKYDLNIEDLTARKNESEKAKIGEDGHYDQANFDKTLQGKIQKIRDQKVEEYIKKNKLDRNNTQDKQKIKDYRSTLSAVIDTGAEGFSFDIGNSSYGGRFLSLGSIDASGSTDRFTGEKQYNIPNHMDGVNDLLYSIKRGNTKKIQSQSKDIIETMSNSVYNDKGTIVDDIKNPRAGFSKSFIKVMGIPPEEILNGFNKEGVSKSNFFNKYTQDQLISDAFVSTKAGRQMLMDTSNYEHKELDDGTYSLTSKGEEEYLNDLFSEYSKYHKNINKDDYFSKDKTFKDKQQRIVKDLVEQGKEYGIGASITRQPLISRTSDLNTTIHFDDDVTGRDSSNIVAGTGLAKILNADYDGDVISSMLKIGEHGDDKTSEYQKKVIRKVFDQIVKTDYEKDEKTNTYKHKDLLDKNLQETRDKVYKNLGSADDGFFTGLAGTVAKVNKEAVGMFSSWSENIRKDLTQHGLGSMSSVGSESDLINSFYGSITAGMGQAIEQDAISSKKSEEKILNDLDNRIKTFKKDHGRDPNAADVQKLYADSAVKMLTDFDNFMYDVNQKGFQNDKMALNAMSENGIFSGGKIKALAMNEAVSSFMVKAEEMFPDEKKRNAFYEKAFGKRGDDLRNILETGVIPDDVALKAMNATSNALGYTGIFGGKNSLLSNYAQISPGKMPGLTQLNNIIKEIESAFNNRNLNASQKNFLKAQAKVNKQQVLNGGLVNPQAQQAQNISLEDYLAIADKNINLNNGVISEGFYNDLLGSGLKPGMRVTSAIALRKPYGKNSLYGLDMQELGNVLYGSAASDSIQAYHKTLEYYQKNKSLKIDDLNKHYNTLVGSSGAIKSDGSDGFFFDEDGNLELKQLSDYGYTNKSGFDISNLAKQLNMDPKTYKEKMGSEYALDYGTYTHLMASANDMSRPKKLRDKDRSDAEKILRDLRDKGAAKGNNIQQQQREEAIANNLAKNFAKNTSSFMGDKVSYETPLFGLDGNAINSGTSDMLGLQGRGSNRILTVGDNKTQYGLDFKDSYAMQTLKYISYYKDVGRVISKIKQERIDDANKTGKRFDSKTFNNDVRELLAKGATGAYSGFKAPQTILEEMSQLDDSKISALADGVPFRAMVNVGDKATGAAKSFIIPESKVAQFLANDHLMGLLNKEEPLTEEESKIFKGLAQEVVGSYQEGLPATPEEQYASLKTKRALLGQNLTSLKMSAVGKTGREAEILGGMIQTQQQAFDSANATINSLNVSDKFKNSVDQEQELSNLQSSQDTYNRALQEEYSLRKQLDGLQAKSANAVGDEALAYKKILGYTEQQYKYAQERTKIAEQGVDKGYAKQQRDLQDSYYMLSGGGSGGAQGGAKQVQHGGFWTGLGNTFKSGLKSMMYYRFVYGLFSKITSEIKKLIQITQQLDKSLTNIRIVTGMNVDEANDLMISYNKLAKEIGTTTQAVAQSGNAWMRQGYSVAEANDLIVASTKLSKLGMLDMESATKVLTSTLKGFKLEAEDAISIVDKLTKLDMNYATSAGEIGEAMSRTSAIASQMGMSLDETAAMVTTIMDITQHSAQMSGTAVRTMLSRYGNVKASAFTDMQQDGEEIDLENINDIEKVMKVLGIQIRSSKLEMRDFTDVLDELAQKWNTLSEVEQNAAATAFGGYRQRNQFQVLMTEWDQVKEATDIAANSAGTADEKYEAYLDSIEAKMQKLQATWEGFVQNLNASPFLKSMYEGLTWVVERFDKILNLVATLLVTLNAFKLPAAFSRLGSMFGGGYFGLKAFNNIGMLGGTAATTGGVAGVTTKSILRSYLPRIAAGVDRTAANTSGGRATGGGMGLYANTPNAFNNKQMLNKSIKNTGVAGKNAYYQTYTNEYGQRMTGTAKYTKNGWMFTDATGAKQNAKDVLSPKAMNGLDNRRTTNNVLTAHKKGKSYALSDGGIAAYDTKTKSFNALSYDKRGNLINRPLSTQEQQLLKSQKAQVTKMRAVTGVSMGLMTGIMAGLSGTNSTFGDKIGSENVKINDIKSDATDNVVNGVATGAATMAISAVGGPLLGMVLGPIIGDGIGGVIKFLRHRDEIERKQRVEEAKKNLEALSKLQSTMKSVEDSIFDMSTAENVSKAKNDVDAIIKALLENNNREDILSKLGKTIEEIESILLAGTEEEKREIIYFINSENDSATIFETFNAQEQDRHEAYKKYNDLASKEITIIGAEIREIIEETGYYNNMKNKKGRGRYGTSLSGNTAADQAKNASEAIIELREKVKLDNITQETKNFLNDEIERLQGIVEAYNDYQAEILKMNKEINKFEVKSAFSKSGFDKWTSLDISSASTEEVIQLFANNLELTGSSVRDSVGEITDYARVQIEAFLRSDERFSSLFSSPGKTLNQIISGLNKQKDLLDQTKADSFEELKNAFDTQNKDSILTYLENMGYSVEDLTNTLNDGTVEFTNAFETASNELMRLVYKYDDSQIEGIAGALNMTTEDLLEMRKLLGGVKLSDLILSPEETRASFDELNNIFSELSTSGTVTGENLEKLNTKYFSLYNNYDEYGDVISTSFDNVLENLRKRLFGDQNTIGTQGFLYQNATFQALKEDFGLYDSFYSQVKNSDIYNMFDENQRRLLESANSLTEIMHLFNDETFGSEMQGILIEILNDLEMNNDYYKEIQDKLIEWQKHENDTIIDNLQSQIDALNDINEERKKEIELIKAKDALENAKKEKVRVYRAGVGWTYEANQQKVSDAEENLEKLERERNSENLQYQIDLLEQQNSILDNISKNEELKALKNSVDEYVSYMRNTFGKNIGSNITSLLTNSNHIMKWDEYIEMMGKQANAAILDEQENIVKNVREIQSLDSQMSTLETQGKEHTAEYIGLQDQRNKVVKSIYESKEKLLNWGIEPEDINKYLVDKGIPGDYNNIDDSGLYGAQILNEEYYTFKELDNKGKEKDNVITKKLGSLYSADEISKAINALEEGSSSVKVKYKSKDAKTWTNEATNVDQLYNLPDGTMVSFSINNHGGNSNKGDGTMYAVKDGIAFKKLEELKDGTFGLNKDVLALINEVGTEGIITPQGTITALPSKTGVVPADLTRNLYNLGEIAPNLVKKLGDSQVALPNNQSNLEDNSMSVENFYATFETDDSFDFEKLLISARQYIKNTKR